MNSILARGPSLFLGQAKFLESNRSPGEKNLPQSAPRSRRRNDLNKTKLVIAGDSGDRILN